MISKEKQEKIKQELEKYTDMALITELYNREIERLTKEVIAEEK